MKWSSKFHRKTSIWRTLYSRHLSIAGKRNNRPYKTFPARNMYMFYFRQVFTVSFRFFFIFVVLFFSQLKWKLAWISRLCSSPWLTCFSVVKMPKAKWSRDINLNMIMEISAAHGQPPVLYSGTLWGQLDYNLKLQSRFLKQNKPIWEELLCSGHVTKRTLFWGRNGFCYREISLYIKVHGAGPPLLPKVTANLKFYL